MSEFKHHKYTWSKPFGTIRHCWELVGENGALHFAVNVYQNNEYPPTCGLEFHHLTGEGAPDHINCHLTGGRCWHDGTSLYAEETVWPTVQRAALSGNHAIVFEVLESEYHHHFSRRLAS
jgi:hypothetical protein